MLICAARSDPQTHNYQFQVHGKPFAGIWESEATAMHSHASGVLGWPSLRDQENSNHIIEALSIAFLGDKNALIRTNTRAVLSHNETAPTCP